MTFACFKFLLNINRLEVIIFSIPKTKGNEILASRAAILFSIFLASIPFVHAEEFPTAPVKLKEAEAQGLHRMTAAELKETLPGKWKEKGSAGGREKTFNPDGTCERSGFGGKAGSGSWRIDERNNSFCQTFMEKKGEKENCFASFRAPDGVHYFDYEIDTGFFQRVRRQLTD